MRTLAAERLAHARSFGHETVDVSAGELPDQIEDILGVPKVDAAVDAVGSHRSMNKTATRTATTVWIGGTSRSMSISSWNDRTSS